MTKRIFESLGELKLFCDYSVQLPDNIPKDCNVICFRHNFEDGLQFFQFYKETGEDFLSLENGQWESSSSSLYHEVEFDKILSFKYYYLRLTTKDRFTPQRLLGVETDRGHIIATDQDVVVCEGSGGWFVDVLRYYISDDSDETVSLDEYIKLFYNTDNTL